MTLTDLGSIILLALKGSQAGFGWVLQDRDIQDVICQYCQYFASEEDRAGSS